MPNIGLCLLILSTLTLLYQMLHSISIFAPPPASYQNVICVDFMGRLGNQLFQYASVLGLATKLNRIPVYSGRSILGSVLRNPPLAASVHHRQRCQTARVLQEKACCRFQRAFHDLDAQEDYTVRTYLQSWKYFEGLEAEVKEAVLFKDSVQQQAVRRVKELRKRRNQTLIGVHVRRGDYINPNHMRLGYRSAPPDYFRNAMAYMRQRFGNVTFLVSVDSREWFLKSVTSAGDVIILTRQDPAVDMALLASLDHVITSVGTYSWWVGFLNNGVTVYWKDFIVPGTFIGDSFDPNGTTFIYPGWIPL